MNTEAFFELEREVSRRGFFSGALKVAGFSAALGPLLQRLSAQSGVPERLPYNVLSAMGKIVIPVDEDPGWATFEPDITNYAMDVFISQVFLAGNPVAIGAFKGGLGLMHTIPATIGYDLPFLEMTDGAKQKYFSDILTNQFETDGVQEVLNFIFILALVAVKAVFFSNFPRHRATPGAEYQVLPVSSIKTGWDIMRWKGPVGPQEETALRARFFDTPMIMGVDRRNPLI